MKLTRGLLSQISVSLALLLACGLLGCGAPGSFHGTTSSSLGGQSTGSASQSSGGNGDSYAGLKPGTYIHAQVQNASVTITSTLQVATDGTVTFSNRVDPTQNGLVAPTDLLATAAGSTTISYQGAWYELSASAVVTPTFTEAQAICAQTVPTPGSAPAANNLTVLNTSVTLLGNGQSQASTEVANTMPVLGGVLPPPTTYTENVTGVRTGSIVQFTGPGYSLQIDLSTQVSMPTPPALPGIPNLPPPIFYAGTLQVTAGGNVFSNVPMNCNADQAL